MHPSSLGLGGSVATSWAGVVVALASGAAGAAGWVLGCGFWLTWAGVALVRSCRRP